jgi:hypothetical membrane protein
MAFRRVAGVLGMAAGVLCWSAMFVFAAVRPSYSHTTNAVSELGALGSPNALLWNIIGFITPGLLLAIAGAAIAAAVSSKGWRTAAFWLLLISGLGFAGTGVFPAEMQNGAVLVTSASTRGHFMMSLVHGIAWVVAAALLFVPMRRSTDWRGWHIVDIVLVILVLVALFGLRGTLSDALVQRVAGAIYFAWFFVFSLRLFQLGRSSVVAVRATA